MEVGIKRPVWDKRKEVPNPEVMMKALSTAGMPLSDAEEDDSSSSKGSITCIAGVVNGNNIHAMVATPSGIIYRFESDVFDKDFWAFAARNYYIVTGNMADRIAISKMTDVWIDDITGKTISRKKGDDLSMMKVDDILKAIGALDADTPAPVQQSFF